MYVHPSGEQTGVRGGNGREMHIALGATQCVCHCFFVATPKCSATRICPSVDRPRIVAPASSGRSKIFRCRGMHADIFDPSNRDRPTLLSCRHSALQSSDRVWEHADGACPLAGDIQFGIPRFLFCCPPFPAHGPEQTFGIQVRTVELSMKVGYSREMWRAGVVDQK